MQGTITIIVSATGVTINGTITRSESAGIPPQEKSLAALSSNRTGTLSTRTSDTAGTLTLQTSHGITDGDTIDIFWTDADGVLRCAYGATVGTVSGNDVPFTGATAGTVLPAQDYEVSAAIPTALDVDFDGDNDALLAAQLYYSGAASPVGGHVLFEDSGDAALFEFCFQGAEPFLWFTENGFTNPITGNPVDQVHVSNADTANAATFKLTGIYESDG
jgi:hypothetical protein